MEAMPEALGYVDSAGIVHAEPESAAPESFVCSYVDVCGVVHLGDARFFDSCVKVQETDGQEEENVGASPEMLEDCRQGVECGTGLNAEAGLLEDVDGQAAETQDMTATDREAEFMEGKGSKADALDAQAMHFAREDAGFEAEDYAGGEVCSPEEMRAAQNTLGTTSCDQVLDKSVISGNSAQVDEVPNKDGDYAWSSPWEDCLKLSYTPDRMEFRIKTLEKKRPPETKVSSQSKRFKGSCRNSDSIEGIPTQQTDILGGMIFGCNKQMWKVCKDLHLFGLPAEHAEHVSRLTPGMKLFLFNFQTKRLTGVFEATGNGDLDIVPNAFHPFGHLTAQVRVKRIMKCPNLPVDFFKNAIHTNFYSKQKFRFELTVSQVEKLVNLFKSAQELIV